MADGRLARLTCQVFDSHDGLPKAEFAGGEQPVVTCDSKGRLWFATAKGIVATHPASIRMNQTIPPLKVERISFYRPASDNESNTGVRRNQQEVQEHFEGPFEGLVPLPAGCRRIEIRYAALSFAAPEKVRFQTKLEGEDDDWHDVGNRHTAYFFDLPPRKYVFHVRAANNDGVWNESGASLTFAVLPHFWQTTWFRAALAFVLVSLGALAAWAWSRSHVRRALEREQVANEIRGLAGRLINAQELERHRIARELHDDFSQRLALLSVEMDLLGASGTAAQGQPAPQLAEVATRVKELSTEVHRMAYELHPAKIDQLGLVAAARGLCRELSQQTGMKIEFEPGTFPKQSPPDVSLCLYRIIQESLQNVIRHSKTREARVELKRKTDSLCLVITDSGCGFDYEKAKREGGLGLSSMQERVRLLHGTLKIDTGPGRGTRIEVDVPLGPLRTAC